MSVKTAPQKKNMMASCFLCSFYVTKRINSNRNSFTKCRNCPIRQHTQHRPIFFQLPLLFLMLGPMSRLYDCINLLWRRYLGHCTECRGFQWIQKIRMQCWNRSV